MLKFPSKLTGIADFSTSAVAFYHEISDLQEHFRFPTYFFRFLPISPTSGPLDNGIIAQPRSSTTSLDIITYQILYVSIVVISIFKKGQNKSMQSSCLVRRTTK